MSCLQIVLSDTDEYVSVSWSAVAQHWATADHGIQCMPWYEMAYSVCHFALIHALMAWSQQSKIRANFDTNVFLSFTKKI